MRALPRIALLLSTIAAPLGAAELQFRDGRVWPGVRVLHQEPTYALVLHEKGIYTVRAEDVTEEAAAKMGIRPPTPEEIAAREAAMALKREEANGKAPDSGPRDEPSVGKEMSNLPAEEETPVVEHDSPPPPRVVEEFSSIVAPARSLPIVRLSGRVLARLARGAIVQADGMPPNHDHGDIGWVVGTIYLQEDGRLNATYRGAALSGRILPAGEHRYTDSRGTEHVLAAWRLE